MRLSTLRAKKALIVVDAKSDANDIVISSANIEGVKTLYVNTLNVYDIIKHDVLIMTKDAVNKTEGGLCIMSKFTGYIPYPVVTEIHGHYA